MTILPKAPRALLRFDEILVTRSTVAVDSEGRPSGSRSTVLAGRGTVSTSSVQEQILAAQRGTNVDKALAFELGLDIRAGDFVTSGGVTYEVVAVEARRLFGRAKMRTVS